MDEQKQCDPNYGCGRVTNSLFSVMVEDWSSTEADEDGLVAIKVCRDCAANGDWADE